MKWLHIVSGIIILICVVTVSFFHTVTLYLGIGFDYWEAVMVVIAVEATFILSCLSLIYGRMMKKNMGISSYAGFIYGTFLVGYSNISYVMDISHIISGELSGWILGGSIPVGLLISESVVAGAVIGQSESDKKSKKWRQTLERFQPKETDQPKEINQPREADQLTESQPTEDINQPAQSTKPTKTTQSTKSAESTMPDKVKSTKPTNQEIKGIKPTKNIPTKNQDNQATNQNEMNKTSTDQPTKATKKPTIKKSTNQPKRARSKERLERLVNVAKEYFKENNEWPTERELIKLVEGESKHMAGKALDTLDPRRTNFQPTNQHESTNQTKTTTVNQPISTKTTIAIGA